MSTKEAQRFVLIQGVLSGQQTQGLAARQLGLTVRQVKRLCKAVREMGAQGLISKKRGQPSNRRTHEERQKQTMDIVHERYADFGPALATEYLHKEHGIVISSETLRTWMVAAGLWKAKVRRAQRIHSPRPRRGRLGELVQIDGSHHAWFEERGPVSCLTAFIDDASGRVLGARFTPTETTQAYFEVLHQCIQTHGVPLALYSDRHGIFTKHDPEDAKPTQFERALLQLDIEGICARSPQAKGRVERLFQTLQDRMCKALRLAGISTLQAANDWIGGYIAQHNRRFAVQPRQSEDAHRAWTGTPQALQRICAHHHQRQLGNSLSCQFEGRILQVHPRQAHAPRGPAQVDIAQYGCGRLELLYRGQVLAHSAYDYKSHLRKPGPCDDKTINAAVDAVVQRAQHRVGTLRAQIAHQDAQRTQGIYTPAQRANGPPREGSGRLTCVHDQSEIHPRGHFYFARKGTFLICVDTCKKLAGRHAVLRRPSLFLNMQRR